MKDISKLQNHQHQVSRCAGPTGPEDVAAILRAIIDEVDSRGSEGHWLSRSSVLVAKARWALGEFDAFNTVPRAIEAAFRDLVSRAEEAQHLLIGPTQDLHPAEVFALLDTSCARAVLKLLESPQSGTNPAGQESKKKEEVK